MRVRAFEFGAVIDPSSAVTLGIGFAFAGGLLVTVCMTTHLVGGVCRKGDSSTGQVSQSTAS